MNKNVPSLRFNGFTDEWSEKKLNEVSTYHASNLTLRSVKTKGDVPLYDANGLIGFTKTNPIREKYVSIIKDGAGVGRIRLLPKNSSIIATMGALLPKDINIDFFYQMLLNYDFSKFITGTTIPHIYFNTYGGSEVKYPSEIEQIKISVTLTKIDTLITLHQQKHEKLINVKKALLDRMFPEDGEVIPSLRLKGFTDEWENHKLNKFYDFFKGRGQTLNSFYEGSDLPAISYGHLYTNYTETITNVSLSSKDVTGILSKTGDLLFPGSSTVSLGTAQASAIMLDGVRLGGDIIVARDKDNHCYAPFMSHQINAKKVKLFPIIVGTTITHMYGKDISNVDYYFPSIPEQFKIGVLFERINDLITLHQQKHEKLINVKKVLLQKMFV